VSEVTIQKMGLRGEPVVR